ncbi:MAG: nicotinamide-nucleotide adenylyltransferase, partial [Thermoplasmata archaeon]
IAPPFNHVYAANPLTKRLFQERGYNVIMPPMYKREIYSGKEIRRRMVMGENWEDLVPKEVADVIMEIDGINRIREISKTDEVQ